MAARRHMIDQLVSNNTDGVQNDHVPINDNQYELENSLPHISHNQITFVRPFTNSLGGAFIYPISSLPHTYSSNIFVNLTSNQIP